MSRRSRFQPAEQAPTPVPPAVEPEAPTTEAKPKEQAVSRRERPGFGRARVIGTGTFTYLTAVYPPGYVGEFPESDILTKKCLQRVEE